MTDTPPAAPPAAPAKVKSPTADEAVESAKERDPEEIVAIVHESDDVEGVAAVPLRALEEVYARKGWHEVSQADLAGVAKQLGVVGVTVTTPVADLVEMVASAQKEA